MQPLPSFYIWKENTDCSWISPWPSLTADGCKAWCQRPLYLLPKRASSSLPLFATFCHCVLERQKYWWIKYFSIDDSILSWEIWSLLLSFLGPGVLWGLQYDSLMKDPHAGVGSQNLQIWIGTWLCLIICILLPNNFQTLMFIFIFCSLIFIALMSFWTFFPSKASRALPVAQPARFYLQYDQLSPVLWCNTVTSASAFLEYLL